MKTKITKRIVDSKGPQAADLFIWDTELTNFGLKITPKGKRIYLVQYWHEGRRRRYTIGEHGPLTPEQARSEAARILGQVAAGEDPAATKANYRAAPSVAELATRYLEEHAEPKKKAASIFRDRQLLKRFVLPALGHYKTASVTRADVSRLHHDLRETPIQANRVLALLSKMFNLAERWGLRPNSSNPCRHVEKFKEHKRERFLGVEELARLGTALEYVEREQSELPSVITAIRLLLFSGCRLSEILTLKWEYLDFEKHCMRLPDSKTGAKVVPLGVPALQLLMDAPRQDLNPYVCPGLRANSHLVGIARPWARIQARAGLSGVRLHDLRHSFASVGAAAGMGLPIIGKLLGHTQSATTQRYAHLHQDPLLEAANEISSRIAEAMSRTVTPKVVSLPLKKN